MTPLTMAAVGRMFGKALAAPGKRSLCPFRAHRRKDKPFSVFLSRNGDEMFRCHACDAPENTGDAVKLYARLSGLDNKAAWMRLREDGFGVPGADARPERSAKPPPKKSDLPGIRGIRPRRVLPLDQDKLVEWLALDAGVLDEFAAQRGLRGVDLRKYGVTEMPKRCVGFVYTDPDRQVPCRVKVRAVDRKAFWCEPRPTETDQDRKALNPLYLAHDLRRIGTKREPLLIVEGEIDALTLRTLGFPNVVSLPDGAESARSVDLSPIYGRYDLWLVASDEDKAGDLAYDQLRERAKASRAHVVRVHWRRIDASGELVAFKDANDALRGGFTREDFAHAMRVCVRDRIGDEIDFSAWTRGRRSA